MNMEPKPQKSRLWGWLLGGIIGGIAGLFSGIACCVGYGLGGVLGALIARAYLGDIKISDGVKVGIVSGVLGPLPGTLLAIGFMKWVTTLPTYHPSGTPEMEAVGMTFLYVLLVFSAIMGIALSIAGAMCAVFLMNYKEEGG